MSKHRATAGWQFFVDRGGTFTDCIGVTDGEVRVAKLLSSDDAPLRGIRALLGLELDASLPRCSLRLGTTLATNALLEPGGAPCGLIITRGFADLPWIGDQSRDDLFALSLEPPRPIQRAVYEVDARLAPDGRVLASPTPEAIEDICRALRRDGVVAIAVVVMHAHANPDFERELADRVRRFGFSCVVASTDVSTEPGLLARMDTAIVDAHTTPAIARYLQHLEAQLDGSPLAVMQSSGGLAKAKLFRGKDAILSGPAGGVVACASIARALGLPAVIGFDMGGTSTDVTRWGGSFERTHETKVGGVRIRTPMLPVHTVAAGGGSLCRFDGLRLSVGPQSAGATPGPLAYGHPDAHEPTLTDVAIVLGRLPGDRFPFPLDVRRSARGIGALAKAANMTVDAVAEGLLTIAVENMARTIRKATVARGHDVREHAMVVFGGAGGQYGCAVARALGIRTLVLHPHAGVLSAWGIGQAAMRWNGEVDGGGAPLTDETLRELEERLAVEQRAGATAHGADALVVRTLALRYAGAHTTLELPWQPAAELRRTFEQRHMARFGHARPGHAVEIVTARVELVTETPPLSVPRASAPRKTSGPIRWTRLRHRGAWHDAPIYARDDVPHLLRGPAVVLEPTGTIVIDPRWRVRRGPDDVLILEDIEPSPAPAVSAGRDPVSLEVMGSRFMAIAEQMGEVLRRTALSTNIVERLDFSCAVFDAQGGLVANAPHMPVHLGAMGASVAAVASAHPTPAPGDVFATNDPAAGGSHLPDITVVTPVFDAGQVAFYVASRGHHADVGGMTPGSMPPHATSLQQEGVVFRATRIVHAGRWDDDAVSTVLNQQPYPARRPNDNIADLQAQAAANQTGSALLARLCRDVGTSVVAAHMRHVQDHAAHAVRDAIARLPFTHARFEDTTDDGLRIAVQLRREHDQLTIDFAGTAGCGDHNLHAPRAVTVAAVLYVLRTLVGEPIPLNRGCLEPITLVIPRPSLLDPDADRAVAGGNVETAQRVVDVLLAAVGRKAASQGTMNNLTLGDGSFGYYETIAGGEGATATHPGRSGVHTHMTNTRITDPETFELRCPVRLEAFALRPGSGGAGRQRGGDGLIRRITLLRPLQLSMLADRRTRPPFGLAGGHAGTVGMTLIDGMPRPGRVSEALPAGTTVCIQTPGGGGFGEPPDPRSEG